MEQQTLRGRLTPISPKDEAAQKPKSATFPLDYE